MNYVKSSDENIINDYMIKFIGDLKLYPYLIFFFTNFKILSISVHLS